MLQSARTRSGDPLPNADRARALSELARATSISAPERSRQLAQEALRDAQAITEKGQRDYVIRRSAGALARTDPEAAVTAARSIEDIFERAITLAEIADTILRPQVMRS